MLSFIYDQFPLSQQTNSIRVISAAPFPLKYFSLFFGEADMYVIKFFVTELNQWILYIALILSLQKSIYEGLDGVYWLLINGLIFCWLLIFGLKFYWLLIFLLYNLTIKAIKDIQKQRKILIID